MYERRFLAIISTKKGPSGVVYCVPVWKQSVITCPVREAWLTSLLYLVGVLLCMLDRMTAKIFLVLFFLGINKKNNTKKMKGCRQPIIKKVTMGQTSFTLLHFTKISTDIKHFLLLNIYIYSFPRPPLFKPKKSVTDDQSFNVGLEYFMVTSLVIIESERFSFN